VENKKDYVACLTDAVNFLAA